MQRRKFIQSTTLGTGFACLSACDFKEYRKGFDVPDKF